jgi:hypothetical protein
MKLKLRTSSLVSAQVLALSVAWLAQGCSSESNTSGAGTGGATSTGGSTQSSTGGSTQSSTGGSTQTSTGGATVTGTGGSTTGTGGGTTVGTGGRVGTGGTTVVGTGGAGGGPPVSGVCPAGTTNGGVCTGTATCSSVCGLADMGSRTCTCNGATNTCARCTFSPTTGGPLDPNTHPVPRPVCAAAIADNVPCTTMGDFCQCDPVTSIGCMRAGTTTVQACLCWPAGAAQTLQWDCDSIPF